MKLASLRVSELRIPFKNAFKHASAERTSTQTIWIEAKSSDGFAGFGEGCPREYVTGESLKTARAFFSGHLMDWLGSAWDIAALEHWVEKSRTTIDANPAAWAAVELALLDVLGKTQNQSVESLLGLAEPAGVQAYSAVLGASSRAQFSAQLSYYLQAGFRSFKIKLAGDATTDRAAVEALAEAGVMPECVRADANNLWPNAETAIRALRALDFPFFAVEEPLASGDFDGMRAITHALGVKIILDESALRIDQFAAFSTDAPHWIVNVRVSKMGGLVRTLAFLRAARARNVRVIVGAHVGESSLLTRVGFIAAAAAGDLLIAQEGAFGTHLLANDVVEHPLMFSAGGVLDVGALDLAANPGFGLSIVLNPSVRQPERSQ